MGERDEPTRPGPDAGGAYLSKLPRFLLVSLGCHARRGMRCDSPSRRKRPAKTTVRRACAIMAQSLCCPPVWPFQLREPSKSLHNRSMPRSRRPSRGSIASSCRTGSGSACSSRTTRWKPSGCSRCISSTTATRANTTSSATLLKAQRPDGSWESYYQAPQGDINSTVECYAALRSVGMQPDDEPLARARRWIFAHGGLRRSSRVHALLARTARRMAVERDAESAARGHREPALVRSTSTTSRAGRARRCCRWPCCPRAARCARCRPTAGSTSCSPMAASAWITACRRRSPWLSWRRLFLVSDRFLHLYQQLGFTPGREMAINACLGWIVRHQDADGAWGGIQPPWIYSLMALNVEGYTLEHPVVSKGLAALDTHWSYERGGTLHIQASESPVWDTLLVAARDAGLRSRAHAEHAARARMGARERSPLLRRLVEEGQRRRAERLGVRARQPALPRHRRHGRRADRARALAAHSARRAANPRRDRPRARLDARDAVEQRRLGRVRQGQRPPDPHEDSVLRFR